MINSEAECTSAPKHLCNRTMPCSDIIAGRASDKIQGMRNYSMRHDRKGKNSRREMKLKSKVTAKVMSYILTAAMLIGGLTLSPLATVEVKAAVPSAPTDAWWDASGNGTAHWDAVDDATSYKVRLRDANGDTIILNVETVQNYYDFSSQIVNERYNFDVRAVNSDGESTPKVEEQWGTVKVNGGTSDRLLTPYNGSINITANSPATGMHFKEWTVQEQLASEFDRTSAETTIIMPASLFVEVTATYEADGTTISNTTVSGTKNTPITDTEATITLDNAIKFNSLSANTDVSTWFTNMPAGLIAKIKTAVAQGTTSATVEFSGTPTVASSSAMTVTIPYGDIVECKSLTIANNANAKWNISDSNTPAPQQDDSEKTSETQQNNSNQSENTNVNPLTWSYSGGSSNIQCIIDKQGPACTAAFKAATPEGYAEAFTFNMLGKDNGTFRTGSSKKTGEFTLNIPPQYRKAGRTFALIGIDKNGRTKIFTDTDLSDNSITVMLDIEGYAFSLIYTDTGAIVPSGNVTTGAGSGTYTVQKGDTLSGIAKKLGKTKQSLINKNQSQ